MTGSDTGRAPIAFPIPARALVVSCQARPDNPLHGPVFMAAMARSAEEGGALGLRVNGPADVAAVRAASRLPIIGIFKRRTPGFPVEITPAFADAAAIVAAGADVVALDGTARPRDGEPLAELIDFNGVVSGPAAPATEPTVLDLRRTPTPAEVAESLGLDEDAMTASLRRAAFVNSLDERVSNGDGEGATRGEMIEDLHHPSPAAVAEGAERAELSARLSKIINCDLGPRAREVLLARSAPVPETWKDLVKRTGLAKPILRQIESAAIAQCRRAMNACGITPANTAQAVGEQLNMLDFCNLNQS